MSYSLIKVSPVKKNIHSEKGLMWLTLDDVWYYFDRYYNVDYREATYDRWEIVKKKLEVYKK